MAKHMFFRFHEPNPQLAATRGSLSFIGDMVRWLLDGHSKAIEQHAEDIERLTKSEGRHRRRMKKIEERLAAQEAYLLPLVPLEKLFDRAESATDAARIAELEEALEMWRARARVTVRLLVRGDVRAEHRCELAAVGLRAALRREANDANA